MRRVLNVLMPNNSETLALSPLGDGAVLAPRAAMPAIADFLALLDELDIEVGGESDVGTVE